MTRLPFIVVLQDVPRLPSHRGYCSATTMPAAMLLSADKRRECHRYCRAGTKNFEERQT
jgi:hypothetical protein